MLVAILSSIVMLGILDRIFRNGRLELLTLKTRHKLLKTKDKLQDAAISGVVHTQEPLFQTLYQSLLNASQNSTLKMTNVYSIGAVWLCGPPGFNDFSTRHRGELAKPDNSRFHAFDRAFQECIISFLKRRHPITFPILNRFGAFLYHRSGGRPGKFNKFERKEIGIRRTL